MSTAEAIHEVDVVPVRRGIQWSLVYFDPCPHCGARHIHGGGICDEPDYGSRIEHCHDHVGEVELVKVPLSDDFLADFARDFKERHIRLTCKRVRSRRLRL